MSQTERSSIVFSPLLSVVDDERRVVGIIPDIIGPKAAKLLGA